MKNIALIVALACLAAPAFAEDEIDSRTKAVNDAYAQEIKQPEATLNAAKETAARAYQKYCKDKVSALEHAVANCEKKIKSAKDAGNKKSEETLTARLAELKEDLGVWKTNADKKWDVQFEEKETDKKAPDKATQTKRWIIGRWDRSDARGQNVATFTANGRVHDAHTKPEGLKYTVREDGVVVVDGNLKLVVEKDVMHGELNGYQFDYIRIK